MQMRLRHFKDVSKIRCKHSHYGAWKCVMFFTSGKSRAGPIIVDGFDFAQNYTRTKMTKLWDVEFSFNKPVKCRISRYTPSKRRGEFTYLICE